MKTFLCKLLGLHKKFIPGTQPGDVKEWIGKERIFKGWNRETKFRCARCGGLP